MPSLRRNRPPRPGEQPLTSVVASAALVSQRSFRRIQRNVGWQSEAWGYYDRCPTLRIGVGWLASACSRAQLYIGIDDPGSQDDPERIDDELAEEIIMELGGGRGNAQMMRALATHLSVAGESYLTGWDDPGTGERVWHAMSSDDVKIVGSKLAIDQGDGIKLLLKEGEFQMIRMWRPHPRWSAQADSPVRSLGGDLAELMGLSQHVLATIDSRLAGAGLLIVPESVTAPPTTGEAEHDDPVMAALIEAMTTPIQDRDSASAVVPLLLRVPDDAAGKVQHIKFGTDFDARILELRDAAIARLAAGIELPSEIVSGLGESNHWTAWQIEESAVKIYVNPLVALICDAITIGYLRPALKRLTHPKADRLLVWYDTSDLVLRPDRSKESIDLHDRGLISDETARRENGFSEDDAPSVEELNRWILLQLAKDFPAMAPGVVSNLTQGVGPIQVTLPGAGTGAGSGTTAPATGAGRAAPDSPAAPSPGAGTRALPSGQSAPPAPGGGPAASARGGARFTGHDEVVAAAEAGVLRALEMAGKRMLPTHMRGRLAEVPAWELHAHLDAGDPDRLLEGAFTLLEEVVAAPCVREACRVYVRTLLETRSPHRRESLDTILTACTGARR